MVVTVTGWVSNDIDLGFVTYVSKGNVRRIDRGPTYVDTEGVYGVKFNMLVKNFSSEFLHKM